VCPLEVQKPFLQPSEAPYRARCRKLDATVADYENERQQGKHACKSSASFHLGSLGIQPDDRIFLPRQVVGFRLLKQQTPHALVSFLHVALLARD
jgi:hypothetical protein